MKKKSKNIASEYLGVAIEEEMPSTDILALLGPVIGNRAGEDAIVDRELRSGVLLTSRAHSKGKVVALQFSVSAGNTKPPEMIVFGLSKPTHTPVTSFGVNPRNHAST